MMRQLANVNIYLDPAKPVNLRHEISLLIWTSNFCWISSHNGSSLYSAAIPSIVSVTHCTFSTIADEAIDGSAEATTQMAQQLTNKMMDFIFTNIEDLAAVQFTK